AVATVNPAFFRLTSKTRRLRASESTRRRLLFGTTSSMVSCARNRGQAAHLTGFDSEESVMRHFRLTGIQNLGDTGSLPSMTDSEDGKNVTELLVSSSGSVTKQNPTSARLYVPQGL